jgi:hypothetical protein
MTDLTTALKGADRVLIIGGPRTGKTTLAQQLELPVHSTDQLIASHDWSEASAEVALWIGNNLGARWVIEGVVTARGLRKWLNRNPEQPLDCVVVLMNRPLVDVTKGQAAMAKGVATVWNEIAPEALRRGVRVVKHDATTPPPATEEAASAH